MKIYCSGKYRPKVGTEDSAGLDLCNNTTDINGEYLNLHIQPGDTLTVQTKTHVQIPKGHVGLVIVRSGHGFRGMSLINSVGVIDADYRGEIGLRFVNQGEDQIDISEGERVAQLVVVPYLRGSEFVESLDELDYTDRGIKGFGSSGKL